MNVIAPPLLETYQEWTVNVITSPVGDLPRVDSECDCTPCWRPTKPTNDTVWFVWLAALFTGKTCLEAVGVTTAAAVDELNALSLLRVEVEHRNVSKAVTRVVVEGTRDIWNERWGVTPTD